ncbi:MAG: OmpA family protein, partial [Candidatus Acidiferrales bacterium]
MRNLGVAGLTILLMAVAAPAALAQGYRAPDQANQKDAYCSGFISSTKVHGDLQIVMGEDAVGRLSYSQYDYIYLGKGTDGGLQVGQRYLVVRPVNSPSSPEAEAFKGEHKYHRELYGAWYKDKYVGQYYQDIGQVEVKIVHPSIATAFVTYACDPVMRGDFLIPMEERPTPEYKPSEYFDRWAPPSGKATGIILPGKDFAYTMGQGDVLYANVGANDGTVVGDYLTLYRPATGTQFQGYNKMEKGQWKQYRGVPKGVNLQHKIRPDLPREILGEALVVRVEEKTVTALITHSLRESHAGDFVEVQPPAPPQAAITVVPATIQRGQTATLSWSSRLANSWNISPSVGAVGSRTGSVNVSPTQNTTYSIDVSGRGGSAQSSATLTVIQPPPPPPPPAPAPAGPSLQELFNQNVQDVFFEFDRVELSPEAQSILGRVADFLRSNPQARILIEGHCDEIGTVDYNMALGARRAEVTRDFLVAQGAGAGQLETMSIGKGRPFCTDSRQEP